jgi:mono/diheme cytochrome c family protein
MSGRSLFARRVRGVAWPLALAVTVAGLLLLTGWEAQANPSGAHSSASSLVREGAVVLAETGCLACHRLGDQDNDGPGPDLTTVGARLTAAAITRALDHPRQPMPSFAALPPQQHRALVAYLASLKSPKDVITPAGIPGLPGVKTHAPSPAQRRAIDHVILTLHRAIKRRDFRTACQQYAPGVRRLFVLAAQTTLHRPSIHSCAHALAAVFNAESAASKLAAERTPHIVSIRIAGATASVVLSETTPQGFTSETATLVHGLDGWKLD